MSAHTDGTGLREQPVGDLVRQLSRETSTLVRQEIDLAKAEMGVKGRNAGKGAGMLGGAGVAGLLTLAALTATVIAALDTLMPTWVAALIATLIWGAVTAALALTGKGRLKQATPPVPEETKTTVKEDVAWAKTRARSARR